MNAEQIEATRARRGGAHRTARPYEQVVIETVGPSIDGGRHPVKGIIGEALPVEATVFRHGHERVGAAVMWKAPGESAVRETLMTLVDPGLDRWRGELPLEQPGQYRFTIAGGTDGYASWVEELRKRVRAVHPDVASEIAEGRVRARAGRHRRSSAPAPARGTSSSSDRREPTARVRERFETPSDDSQTSTPWVSRWCTSRRFTPIGRTGRKGPNNRLEAGPDDPGSPWAIGNEHGGHTAVEPTLGTLEDFDRFVRAADTLGMEVALDFAIQCSPDHPWVHEHPAAREPAHLFRVER